MERRIKSIFLCGIMILLAFGFAYIGPVSVAAEVTERVSGTEVVRADSEKEAMDQLKKDGYTPVAKNLADDDEKFAGKFVYMGYKTSDDPAQSIENSISNDTGSVFGGSYVIMIGGFGMILGVIVGMISMKVKDKGAGRKDGGHE